MAISQEQTVALVGGAAVLGGAYLLTRQRAIAPSGQPTFTFTGPTESTVRETIRAGVDLADIYASADVRRIEINSRERIRYNEIRSGERIAISELASREEISRIIAETVNFRTAAEREARLAQIRTEGIKDIFDFLGGLVRKFFFL